jgi:hypothetical protein
MKKWIIFMLAFTLGLLMVSTVSASYEISPGLDFGKIEPGENKTLKVSLKKTSAGLANINLPAHQSEFESGLILSTDSFPFGANINNGQSLSFEVTLIADESTDAVERDGDELKPIDGKVGLFHVGTVVNGFPENPTFEVQAEIENKLEIKDSDILVKRDISGEKDRDADSGRISITDDRDIKVRPGDKLIIELEIQNKFSSKTDIDFDDVTVEIDIEDDEDFDFDEEPDSFSLDTKDEKTVTFELEVNEDADRDSHRVRINLEGRTGAGGLHGETLEFDLDVERKSRDIAIRDLDISPDKIACDEEDRTVSVDFDIFNRGNSDEDEVAIEVSSQGLDFKEKQQDIDLPRDDSQVLSFTIPVEDDAKVGTQRIRLTTFVRNTVKVNTIEKTVVIEKCDVPAPEVKAEENQVTQATGAQATQAMPPIVATGVEGVPTVARTEVSSTGYLVLLGVLIALVLLGIVLLVVVLIKQRKKDEDQ